MHLLCLDILNIAVVVWFFNMESCYLCKCRLFVAVCIGNLYILCNCCKIMFVLVYILCISDALGVVRHFCVNIKTMNFILGKKQYSFTVAYIKGRFCMIWPLFCIKTFFSLRGLLDIANE